MELYDLIAGNYEKIFPLENEKVDFIKTVSPPPARILDAGCATGELAIALSKAGYETFGIDLNAKMIGYAKSAAAKNLQPENKIRFETESLTAIGRFGIFDAVLCFGNTLPHLADGTEVSAFFASVYKSLSDNGTFVFQLLNYDKILSEKKADFVIKETDGFIFKRRYEFLPNGKIEFIIEFTDKMQGKTHTGSTTLLPLTRQTLCTIAEKTGFTSVTVYSDYGCTKSDLHEYSSVYIAKKGARNFEKL